MANKVYILVCDARDSRNINVAFRTRVAAEAARRLSNAEAAVEELILDPELPAQPSGHRLWYVTTDDGLSASRGVVFEGEQIGKVLPDGPEGHCVDVWARNERHALEVDAELIERHKAEQAGKGTAP